MSKKGAKKELSFVEIIKKISSSGISGSPAPNRESVIDDSMPSLEIRIKKILQIIDDSNNQPGEMIFFIMYDIESNRVRHQVVKYLQKKGCMRIQKSIFLASLPSSVYENIKADLTEVQACYDNQDSILVVPITTDYLAAMKIIGQNIDIDVITKKKNVLFF